MTRDDMDRVRDEFVRAAQMGERCGFDLLELHCAHGYLLSSFITPLTNRRTDEYGGIAREPAAVSARGVRRGARGLAGAQADVGAHLGDRLGRRAAITADDAVEIARAFAAAGADLIDVSAGQTSRARAAGLRPHVPDAVLGPDPQRAAASRRWRSATSPRPIRSTASSPPGAPIWSRWRGRTSPIRTSRCTRRRSSATTTSRGREQYLPGREQHLRNAAPRRALAAEAASEVTQ